MGAVQEESSLSHPNVAHIFIIADSALLKTAANTMLRMDSAARDKVTLVATLEDAFAQIGDMKAQAAVSS